MRTKPNPNEESPVGRWRAASTREVLARWRESGLSASAFGRLNGLANSQRLC
jgi:hypothetical protein